MDAADRSSARSSHSRGERSGQRYGGAARATLSGILDRAKGRRGALALRDDDRLDEATCLVTGANRGLGLAVALDLARRGGRVVMAGRSGMAGAAEGVARASERDDAARPLGLDLSDLASVGAALDELEREGTAVDVAVLNAGIVPREARRTTDGFDESFQVNFLANVLLARGLVERTILRVSSAGGRLHAPRLIVVSSESHRSAARIDWTALGTFRAWTMREAVEQYGYSKLLLQVFTEELVRRTRGRIAVHSLCPGAVRTDIGREAPGWAKPVLDLTMRAFFKTPAEAAIPVVYLAAARAMEGETGVYLHATRRRAPSEVARDPESGRRIWDEASRILREAGHDFVEPEGTS
jgi:NAD(P)-dependent dehydrogenase (short-subunit alcohol dehydrogenase family)